MKKIFYFLFFCPALLNAQALKEFPSDPKEFYVVIGKFIEETNADQAEALMAELNIIWSTEKLDVKAEEKMYKDANKFYKKRTDEESLASNYQYSSATARLTEAQKKEIIRTCNLMLKKRMKAIPDFKNYLLALLSFQIGNQSQESFDGWQSSINKLLEKSNKYFTSYIRACNNLFSGNLLYLSTSTRWTASNSNYIFDFDSVPKIIFKEITLSCNAKNDSSVIYETKGTFYPTLSLWKGIGGKVNFVRCGFSVEEAKAEFGSYTIDVSGADFVVDSALFFFPKYFKEALRGRFADKILANVTPENASYPRFETDTKILQISDIVPDVDYLGGFSLQGRKIVGIGTNVQPAQLTYYLRDKPFLVASSHSFVIRPERITSDRTAITLYLDTAVCNPHCDSIYHPSLQFKYVVADRSLALLRSPEGVGNSPFYDSFHKVDMHFEGIYWKIDEPLIEMKMITGGAESKAYFESVAFYKDAKYSKLQGLGDTHPFTIIKKYTSAENSRYIQAEDYAAKIKAPPDQVRALLMSLATQGFTIYLPSEDQFYVTDRLYYYLDAKVSKTDYDVIQFESIPGNKKPNAEMNLLNFDLSIFGVSRIQVSDSQNVFISPRNREIILKANRDFTFSGRVNAGRFEFFGNNFAFDYDNFKVNLTFIDSMRMKIPGKEKDAMGNIPLVSVKSVIQYINGNLLIDDPSNKSGIKDYNEYPIFNSFKDSYVFYDKGTIQQGVYLRDNFFFHLEPFIIDSINSFDPAFLGLKGNFISAGIFPDFDEILKIQPDYSLGFVRPTPAEGFPAYGGKGTYSNLINLSNEGLRGDGILNYVTSISTSNNFIFFPDSMNSHVQRFEVKAQGKPIEFPPVIGEEVYVHWRPYKDRMLIYQKKKPIDFYAGQVLMSGNLELTPQMLTGAGLMEFTKAELRSKLFRYRETAFGADTSDFNLKSEEVNDFAFKTVNVNSEIDLIARTGTFKSNGGASFVEFPVNQYICYMDQFKWYMDEKMVELGMGSKKKAELANSDSSNINLEGSEFISTNSDQDSLRWIAPYAKYFLSENIIRAEEVKYINVADALLYPDSGKVTVQKKAKLDPFKNARLTANSTTKYHNLYNVNANVLGRKNYNASGDYDYLDIYNKKQTINFSKIQVDTTFQTYANSAIDDSIDFTLIPQISFKGDASLNASNQFLVFTGYGKLAMQCENMSSTWFKFSSEINPAEVFIPLGADLKDENNELLNTSISLFNDSISFLYTSLFAPKRSVKDVEVLLPAGYLFYDKNLNEYRIASREKLGNKSLPGNAMYFNDTKCLTQAEGKINFGAETGQFKMTCPGIIKSNSINNTSEIDVMMLFDFFFTDGALKEMAEVIEKTTTLIPADNSRPEYEKGLAEILDKERAGKLISELNLYGSFKKMPDELLIPLVLTQVKMNWSDETRSFRSSGPIAVGNILKTQLNKTLQGQIEIQKKKGGDVVNVYLEVDPANWFFFRYSRGVLEAVSSIDKFNSEIKNLKADKRQAKSDKELGSFEFILSSEKKKSDFLRKTAIEPKDEE